MRQRSEVRGQRSEVRGQRSDKVRLLTLILSSAEEERKGEGVAFLLSVKGCWGIWDGSET
jgi:hypothetical protein